MTRPRIRPVALDIWLAGLVFLAGLAAVIALDL